MRTFVRVVELWLPGPDKNRLHLAGGIFGELTDFRDASRSIEFGHGEGLPGRAWALGRPIILRGFEDPQRQRADAARAAGLTCGVALPVLAGEVLTGVVALYCGGGDDHVGAIELWHNDLSKSHELRLADGYFGSDDMFAFNARHIKFPPGYGLPGRAWKTRAPVLVKDLHDAKRFLRWEQAREIGINVGFGIPYERGEEETWVITFLSSARTPVARRIELWERDAKGDGLVFRDGYCDTGADLASMFAAGAITKGEGAVGRAWLTGAPVIRDGDVGEDQSIAGRAAREAGMSKVVVLPVLRGGAMRAAVAWYI